MGVAYEQGWQSIAVGILRQELDSMVRVIYLLSQRDHKLREQLLAQAVSGEAWTVPTPNGKLKKVRDSEMVDLAQGLQGWTRLVYRFGCSFIHLSNLHDYQARDPFKSLPLEERLEISRYLCQFHGGDISANSVFDEVVAYVPKVLDKVTRNLEIYVDDLEHARGLT
jgi:hypothetical protein